MILFRVVANEVVWWWLLKLELTVGVDEVFIIEAGGFRQSGSSAGSPMGHPTFQQRCQGIGGRSPTGGTVGSPIQR